MFNLLGSLLLILCFENLYSTLSADDFKAQCHDKVTTTLLICSFVPLIFNTNISKVAGPHNRVDSHLRTIVGWRTEEKKIRERHRMMLLDWNDGGFKPSWKREHGKWRHWKVAKQKKKNGSYLINSTMLEESEYKIIQHFSNYRKIAQLKNADGGSAW